MHILIDARIVTSHNFGLGRYGYNLLKALIAIDKNNRFTLLVNDNYLADLVEGTANFRLLKVKSKWLSIREQFELPRIIRKVRPDLFHTISISIPVSQPCPTVATVSDLIHVLFSEHYSLIHKLYYRLVLKRALRKVTKVITMSESTRRDIMKQYDEPPDKIVVVYLAAEKIFQPIDDKDKIAGFKKKFGLPDRFVLYVGNRKKHKNVAGLIEAFALFSKQITEPYALVL